MNHTTIQDLQEYQDGLLDGITRRNIESHIEVCNECRARLFSIHQIDVWISGVPLEQVSTGFTQRVLKSLRIEPTPTYAWKAMQYLAPILAFASVIGIVYALLQFTGAYENSELYQSVQLTRSVSNNIGHNITEGLTAVNTWMEKYLFFAFAKNSYGLTTFLLVFFGAIALLDKYLLMPLFRKRFYIRR